MTREEIQIQQIDMNIAGLEKRINLLRTSQKSVDTPDKIIRLEQIIADLKGYKAWYERRLERDKGTA